MSLLIPSAFLASLGIGLINLGMLFVVKESYAASPAAVGWFTALWSMAYFTGCLVLRPLQRRIRARTSMATMNIGVGLLFVFHILVPGLVSAFIVYALFGVFTALFWPRVMGWLSRGLEGAELSRASSRFSLSWSIGGVIAPYLAGLLSEKNRFLPIWVAVGVFALNGAFILGTSRRIPCPSPLQPQAEKTEPDRSTFLRFPAWIGVSLIYILAAVFFNIFPIYAKDELGLTESRIGFLLLLRAFATMTGFWFLGRYGAWRFKRSLITVPLLVGLGLDIGFALVRSPFLLSLGLVVLGFSLALAYNNSMFYGASGAADRERRMTIHEALLTAGQILGSIGGGSIYQAASWRRVFIVLALPLLAGLGAQLLLIRRKA